MSDRNLETKLAQSASVCDQDWSAGVDWVAEMDMGVVLELREAFINDDASNLINWMTNDANVADIVQRMGLLALDELLMRRMKMDNDIE